MKKSKQTLLWQLTGDVLPAASYIFGTMHVRNSSVIGQLEHIYKTIDSCEAFATEFDLQEAALYMTPQDMLLPDGQRLLDFMEEKKYQKLRKILHQASGLNLDDFQQYKPIFIINMLTEKILTADMQVSLDEYLWQYARQAGKKITGIETYAEQRQILQRIPIEEQVQALKKAGQNIATFRKQLFQLTNVYATGNIQRIFLLSKRQSGKWRKALLYRRNVNMAERIYELAQEHTLFAAIGAGHLGGQQGVLRLLKQQQLTIKPVSFSQLENY